MKEVYLVFVDPVSNHNKFYRMIEKGSTFVAEWGRVGSSSSTKEYPIGKWHSLLEEKKKKGYQETSSSHVTAKVSNEIAIKLNEEVKSSIVKKILSFLIACTKENVSKNYNISSFAVTKEQIKIAQNLIDELSMITFDKNWSREKSESTMMAVNDKLIAIYTQIPRKMKKVNENIFSFQHPGIPWKEESFGEKISSEQDILDSMKTKKTIDVQEAETEKDKKVDIPFIAEEASDEEIELVKKMMKENSSKVVNVLRITNKETEEKFNKAKETMKNKKTNLLFHGSRNENWYGIMSTGLVLRPSNAVINGKMFGYGTYFADKSQKSIGYSSLSGSYWAKGSSNTAFIAVYEVLVGNQYNAKRHEYWMSDLNDTKLKQKGDFDSLFAEGGYDLRNNEYIVYKESQSTIRYLIEIRG